MSADGDLDNPRFASVPTGRSFRVELSVALGFVGLAQVGIRFVLIGRFRPPTYPYGLDVVLKYHRQIAIPRSPR